MDRTTKLILISGLLSFAFYFEADSVAIILPYISKAFNLSSIFTVWISISFLLLSTSTGLFCGKIISKFGLIKTSKFTLILMFIGSLLSIFSINAYMLFIGKAIEGFASGCLFIASMIFIVHYLDSSQIGQGLGVNSLGIFLSAFISPIIAGFLSSYLSWRIAYGFILPIIFILLILVYSLKEKEYQKDETLDIKSMMLWFVSVITFIFGVSFLNSKMGMISFIVGLILMGLFVYYQLHIKNPIYNFRLLKDKIYLINSHGSGVQTFLKVGIPFVLTLYLYYVRALSSIEISFILGIYGIVLIVVIPIAGRLSDKYDSVKLSNGALILMVIASLILLFINQLSLSLITASLIIAGIGFVLYEPSNKKIIFNACPDEEMNNVSSFLSTSRDMYNLLSKTIFSLILSFYSFIPVKKDCWAISSQMMFIIFFVLVITLFIFLLYTNRNLELITKFDFNKIKNNFENIKSIPKKIILTTSEFLIDNTGKVIGSAGDYIVDGTGKIIDTTGKVILDTEDYIIEGTEDIIDMLNYFKNNKNK